MSIINRVPRRPRRPTRRVRDAPRDSAPAGWHARRPFPAIRSASPAFVRDYTAADVAAPGRLVPHPPHAGRNGRARLWHLLKTEPYVNTLGALTGNQAVQQVKAGLKAIYLSGWQVAADANTGGQMYPDQSLYPVDSVPNVVRRINNALRRCDQISQAGGRRLTAPTGWRRSWPTPRPGSAAR